MIILRNIVAAATSILLVLLSTPAGVEGTNKCIEVCPNYHRSREGCWRNSKYCPPSDETTQILTECCDGAYCVCNVFGYNCDGCGTCGSTRRMLAFDDENEDNNCADFESFTSLSADGKRNSLAEKYCLDDGQVVREDIYELLRDFTVLQFEGDVLTCFMFNNAYFDVSDLTLCDNKQHHPNGVPASNKKSKKQKKTS